LYKHSAIFANQRGNASRSFALFFLHTEAVWMFGLLTPRIFRILNDVRMIIPNNFYL
jgi:hypothetical protein